MSTCETCLAGAGGSERGWRHPRKASRAEEQRATGTPKKSRHHRWCGKQTDQGQGLRSVLQVGLSHQGLEDEEEPLVQKKDCSERGQGQCEGAEAAPAEVSWELGRQLGQRRVGSDNVHLELSSGAERSLSMRLVSSSSFEFLKYLATAPRAQGGDAEGSVTTLLETQGRSRGRLTRPPLAFPMGELFFLFRCRKGEK